MEFAEKITKLEANFVRVQNGVSAFLLATSVPSRNLLLISEIWRVVQIP